MRTDAIRGHVSRPTPKCRVDDNTTRQAPQRSRTLIAPCRPRTRGAGGRAARRGHGTGTSRARQISVAPRPRHVSERTDVGRLFVVSGFAPLDRSLIAPRRKRMFGGCGRAQNNVWRDWQRDFSGMASNGGGGRQFFEPNLPPRSRRSSIAPRPSVNRRTERIGAVKESISLLATGVGMRRTEMASNKNGGIYVFVVAQSFPSKSVTAQN